MVLTLHHVPSRRRTSQAQSAHDEAKQMLIAYSCTEARMCNQSRLKSARTRMVLASVRRQPVKAGTRLQVLGCAEARGGLAVVRAVGEVTAGVAAAGVGTARRRNLVEAADGPPFLLGPVRADVRNKGRLVLRRRELWSEGVRRWRARVPRHSAADGADALLAKLALLEHALLRPPQLFILDGGDGERLERLGLRVGRRDASSLGVGGHVASRARRAVALGGQPAQRSCKGSSSAAHAVLPQRNARRRGIVSPFLRRRLRHLRGACGLQRRLPVDRVRRAAQRVALGGEVGLLLEPEPDRRLVEVLRPTCVEAVRRRRQVVAREGERARAKAGAPRERAVQLPRRTVVHRREGDQLLRLLVAGLNRFPPDDLCRKRGDASCIEAAGRTFEKSKPALIVASVWMLATDGLAKLLLVYPPICLIVRLLKHTHQLIIFKGKLISSHKCSKIV
mmetsp:Transcript_58257/g.126519  ORF Transcript_58257/g.126519 Transcript_58257/m.126519 type:complete len:449 (+) Transcript_58257:385-1731(+)